MSKQSILIVDDNPINIKLLFDILQHSGFRVSVAKSGERALSKVQNTLPDLILLDVMMPGIDGFETCRHLKDNSLTQEIPIIFLSAISEVDNKIKAFDVGGVDYITKPFHTEEVLARVKNQLALQAAKAEIEELNVELEQRVQQRTAQLAVANQELEREITERQQAEAALQQAYDELEARVEERTTELRKTNEQLRNEIAERQRAEAALRSSMATNRALLNAIPDSMFRISRDGTFVNFKAAKDNNLPIPCGEFLGKSLYDVLPIEIAQPMLDCVQKTLQTGDVQILEYQQLLIDNNLLDYEARFAVSAVDEVMAIVRNITERKQAEADIRNALRKEKEIRELKSRFVTMTSHEFRTPLTTILSSAELLENYSHKWTEEKKLHHFQRIQAAVKHMTQLLNDVLLVGKAEAGKLEFKPLPLDLAAFCRNLVEEMQLGTSTHLIDFCIQGQCTNACMDEKLLRHILSNLLSNAIKYSPQGGTVNFDLLCEAGKAVFRLQDRGIGIPAAEQAQLFNSFHRASNVGTISGTGLGLAIVKKSVDLHGGQIAVNSEVGVGTTFTLTLPLHFSATGR